MERHDVISAHVTSSALRDKRGGVRVAAAGSGSRTTHGQTSNTNPNVTQVFPAAPDSFGSRSFLKPKGPVGRVPCPPHTERSSGDPNRHISDADSPGGARWVSSSELYYTNPANGEGGGCGGRLTGDLGTSFASGNCHHAGNLSATQNAAADKNMERVVITGALGLGGFR